MRLDFDHTAPGKMIDNAQHVLTWMQIELFLPLQLLIVYFVKLVSILAIKSKCQVTDSATVLNIEQVTARP